MEDERTHADLDSIRYELDLLRREQVEATTRLEAQVQRAIHWEREQCAQIADTAGGGETAEMIAARIRARGYEHG